MTMRVASGCASSEIEEGHGWHARGERAHCGGQREGCFAELDGRHGGREVVLAVSAVEAALPAGASAFARSHSRSAPRGHSRRSHFCVHALGPAHAEYTPNKKATMNILPYMMGV